MGGLNNSTAHRRVSPRLANVPVDERPFYGSNPKRTPNAAQNDVVGNKKAEVEIPSSAPAPKLKREANSSESMGGLNNATARCRVSPRLANVPVDKRPFYGSNPKRTPDATQNDVVGNKKAKVENPSSAPAPKLKREANSSESMGGLNNSTAQSRVSPRLANVPVDKRPFYYSNPKRTPDATQNDVVGNKKAKVENPSSAPAPKLKREVNSSESMGGLYNSIAQRRVSPRLANLPVDKRPFYYSNPKRTPDATQNDVVGNKKAKVENPSSAPAPKLKREVNSSEGERMTRLDAAKWFAPALPLTDNDGISYTVRLRETFRLLNVHYLHFVQNGSACCDDLKEPSKKPTKNQSNRPSKRTSKRPDLKAISEMLKNNKILFPERKFGHLPGIEVGHQFFSLAEMVAAGLHGHWLSGIDFIGESTCKEKYKHYTLPLTVSIVISGQYDDLDNPEEVVYTGQGGNDLLGDKKLFENQVMRQGNLALKNNMKQSIPIRVIRGHSVNSYKKVYTYDGLYEVVHHWLEAGAAGYEVFKYRLKRLPGQPKLLSKQVHFTRRRGSKTMSEIPGLVCKDICNGQENICIPATNVIDVPPVAPEGLIYTKSIKLENDVNIPSSSPGCICEGSCTDPATCSCAQLNGSDFPYVAQDGGRLIEAKAVVFECGPNCGCGPSCVNRTSQRGLKYQLELYRTPDKGWAVRSWDFIPSGAPVCEYTGVLRKNNELDSVSNNDFIFEIDCWHTMNGIGAREKRLGDVSIPNSDAENGFSKLSDSEAEFCIDAGSYGNVARYINHSCEPNLFVQCILSSHHDVRLARIVLFAADDIPPMQELTYDYGYELDSVVGPDGKIKKLPCYCGTDECRKRLY